MKRTSYSKIFKKCIAIVLAAAMTTSVIMSYDKAGQFFDSIRTVLADEVEEAEESSAEGEAPVVETTAAPVETMIENVTPEDKNETDVIDVTEDENETAFTDIENTEPAEPETTESTETDIKETESSEEVPSEPENNETKPAKPDIELKERRIKAEGEDIYVSGLLPADVKVTAEKVEVEVSGAKVIAAYDIKVFDKNGNEWQPAEPLKIEVVSEECNSVTKNETEVIYVPDEIAESGKPVDIKNENIEKIDAEVKDGKVEFEAGHFSVYIIIEHEGGEQQVARRVYHFIGPDYTESLNGNIVRYSASPYMFSNKGAGSNGSENTQCTQIILNGESLEKVVNPPDKVLPGPDNQLNTNDDVVSHFYGWYIVEMKSDSSDMLAGGGTIVYTWGDEPTTIEFDQAINFTASEISAKKDTHYYLAPIYVNYHFVKFHEITKAAEDAAYSTNSNYIPKLISRRMVALNDNNEATVLVSDVVASPTDNIHYMFRGWAVYIDGVRIGLVDSKGAASLSVNGAGKVTGGSLYLSDYNGHGFMGAADVSGRYIMTFDSAGIHITDPKYYITLSGAHDVDLYPVFNEIRWVYYTVGTSSAKGTYVPSKLILTKDTENGDNTITADELGISYRTGYVFDGWYTSDSGTISLDREGTFDVSGKTRVAYFDQATEKMVFDSSFKSQHSSETTAVGGFYYDESSQNVSERGLHVSEDWNDDPDNGGKRLTLYAHWTKVSTAQYKVVIWKQKDTDEAGILESEKTYDYDRVYLSNPVSTSEGIETSNELSNFTGTENYENSVSGINLANLGNTYADDFKGFVYARADWTDGNTIEPDGSTIINLYYDRITYNLKFFFARRQNNGNYYVPSLSGSNLNPPALNQPQTWQNYLTNSGNLAWQDSRTTDITQICKYPYSSATNGNYTYYYYVITANYGTQIGDKWPEYSQFADANHRVNNYFLVSWWMMRGAENYYVEGGTVRDTVKGKVLTMDEQILGNLSDPDGNFLFTRFGTSTNNWYYRIWQEELEGVDYGDKQKVTKDDGITYVNTETIEVKSGQTSASGQNAPAFLGFTNKDSYTQFTNQNNSYYMDYYYTRDVNDFIFKDNWPDGSNRPGLTLNVKFDASLSDFGFEKNGTITNWYYGVADDFNTVDNTLVAPDHYKFGGWYEDSTCNVPFDFNSKMPAANKAVYAKWIEVQYSAEIDPNGGTIDHITPSSNPTQSGSGSAIIDGQSYTYSYSFSNFSYGRSEYNGSYSTYVNLSYGEALGQYDLSRSYVPITAEEAQERISAGKPVFYYVNTRRTNSGVFLDNCGSTGLPSALRNAIFLKADDNDAELKAYFLFYVNSIHFTLLWGGDRYADAIDFMESDSNSDGKPDAYTRINYNTQALFNAWLGDINTSGSNANRLYNEWLSTYNVKSQYYRATSADEEYQLLNWYIIESDDPSEVGQIFNFNSAPNHHIVIKAEWRLNGRYHLEYVANGATALGGHSVNADITNWRDPDIVDGLTNDYSDNTETIVREQPRISDSSISENYIFRGWYIAGYKETTIGSGIYVADPSVAMEGLSNGEPLVFYNVGDKINVYSIFADPNGIIHMQAYFETYDGSQRRPHVTNLSLDANVPYGGSVNSADGTRVVWTGCGFASVANNGSVQQIVFGDIQSSADVHLYRYATDKTEDAAGNTLYPAGTKYFVNNENKFVLIGFDASSDPESIDYIPEYAADAVVAVTRKSNQTLYAIWEPMVYISFKNNTDKPVTVDLSGTQEISSFAYVNEVTGEFDRTKTTDTILTIPANATVKLVLPWGQGKTYSAKVTGHDGYEMTVSNVPVTPSTANKAFGTFYNEETDTFTGTLDYSATGAVITISEKPLVTYDLNTGSASTVWMSADDTWFGTHDATKTYRGVTLNKLYTESIAQNGTRKATKPVDPTYDDSQDRSDGGMFIGWTLGVSDGTGGYTAPAAFGGSVDEYDGSQGTLFDFNTTVTEPITLYAVWSLRSVIFDINGGNQNWTPVAGFNVFTHSTTDLDQWETLVEDQSNYEPNDPTRTNYIFVGWVKEETITALNKTLTNTDWSGTTSGATGSGTEYVNDLAYIKANLWNFSAFPPYGETLYAVWSSTVKVTFNLQSGNSTTNNLHTWTDTDTTYYQTNGNYRREATIAKGDTVREPSAPIYRNSGDYAFYKWQTVNNHINTTSYTPSNHAALDTNAFDFDAPVTTALILYTSWLNAESVQVTITKTVENGTAADLNKEFEFEAKVITKSYRANATRTQSGGYYNRTYTYTIDNIVCSDDGLNSPEIYTFKLKDGESKTITLYLTRTSTTLNNTTPRQITASAQYVILSELLDNDNYVVKINGAQLTDNALTVLGWTPDPPVSTSFTSSRGNESCSIDFTINTDTTINFTNERITEPVTVKKTVIGNGGTFTFTAQIKDDTLPVRNYTLNDNGTTDTADDLVTDAEGKVTFTLSPAKDGSDNVILNVPKGAALIVNEAEPAVGSYTTGYSVTVGTNIIMSGSGYSTGSLTVGSPMTIEFINTEDSSIVAPTAVKDDSMTALIVMISSATCFAGAVVQIERKKRERGQEQSKND